MSRTSFGKWAALLGVSSVVFGACNKESTAAPEPGRAQPPEPFTAPQAEARPQAPAAEAPLQPAPAPGAAASGLAAEARGEGFELALRADGPYTQGKAGTATLELVATPPYKVNEEYPYKFKVREANGLKLDKDVLTKEHVKLEEKRAVMSVPFTPESPGKKVLTGQFAFSVCTEDRCLIEKQDLSLEFEVGNSS